MKMEQNNKNEVFIIPKFKEEELFPAPENFFDGLSEKALVAAKAADSQRKSTQRKWFYYISSAAAAALVIVLSVFFISKNNDNANLVADNVTPDINNTSIVTETPKSDSIEPNSNFSEEHATYQDKTEKKEKNIPSKQKTNRQITSDTQIAAATSQEVTPPEDETPIYACSTDFDELCFIDYQFIEYYNDEIVDSEYGDFE